MINDTLSTFIKSIDPNSISKNRRQILLPLINYIKSRYSMDTTTLLNFVCTHNSRRSQIAQIWAQVAANLYGLDMICYSGGTEVTTFNERAVAAVQRTGIGIQKRGNSTNPTYLIQHTYDTHSIVCFSKKYDDPFNPISNFAAVMTCADADENCPFIPGVDVRIKVTYDDPKVSDDTLVEQATYDERVRQIATEMFYVMANVVG